MGRTAIWISWAARVIVALILFQTLFFKFTGAEPGDWYAEIKDGKVTEAEATAAALSRFDAADTNKDGTISDAERQAAREKMRAAWKAKKPN